MQMLGAQVLFGFALQGCFQPGFEHLSEVARLVDALGVCCVALTFALLVAPACQHRLVERGHISNRILRVTGQYANAALFTLALTLGCNVYVVVAPYVDVERATSLAALVVLLALLTWYGWGLWLRMLRPKGVIDVHNEMSEHSSLHNRIDHLLTEARVILPGAQALLGFQLVVTLSTAFERMSAGLRLIHFLALLATLLAIVMLIVPAAIHRLAFAGTDSLEFHSIGSRIVTIALLPLIIGTSADTYVAAVRMLDDRSAALAVAVSVSAGLACLWYALPLWLRERKHES